jgi:homoserine kinase
MIAARSSVLVRVPGSTSNLGSGFDTLGLAVNLFNRVRVARVEGRGLTLVSPLPEPNRSCVKRMLSDAARRFFQRTGVPPIGVAVSLGGDVPPGRGLGASATARLGLAAGLNELTGAGLPRTELLELVTDLEGHPDNASPAICGGFTVSGRVGGQVRCLAFPVSPRLRLVTLIPPFELNTEHARRLLPAAYSRQDAAHALNRAALITAAFARGDYESLRGVFDDRLHQPRRRKLIPQLARVIRAGEEAGAIGGFLSGAGSAIICLTLKEPDAIGRAMQREMPEATVRVLRASNRGFQVIRGSWSGRRLFV